MNYYLTGIAFGVIFVTIIFLARRLRGSGCDKYDERQAVGRGRAFRAGFYTLLILNAAVDIWEYSAPLPGEPLLWHISALLLGVLVFALTAIHYDAYVGMSDKPERFIRAGILFVAAMLLSGIANLISDEPGSNTMAFLNIALLVMWLCVIAALLLHRSRQEDAE